MRNAKLLFTSVCLFAAIIVTGTAIWHFTPPAPQTAAQIQSNKYGDFLAAQHAIYKNDFGRAAEFMKDAPDRDLIIVRNSVILANFLNGRLPDDPDFFNKDSNASAQLIHDAYLLKDGDWSAVYAKHKKDESTLAAPLRIWSGVATNKISDTVKFINSLKTNDSWKAFAMGQVYAETGKTKQAGEQFAKVAIDFMNLNDYMYIMAFYNANDMTDAAATLHENFTSMPGGMFMLDYKTIPDWSNYAGPKRALTFSLVQNVSHTTMMMYSDLSLLLLRFAEIVQGGATSQNDAINYYLGQYFFNNGGDYEKFYNSVEETSPFYPFAIMKIAEKSGKIPELERAIRANPLFVPAIAKLVAKNVQNGDERKALRVINHALDNSNLTSLGRAFFLKSRAQVYLTFGKLDYAQDDIYAAAKILPMDAGILAIQSRIWSTQDRELDTAYEYAIALVHKTPTDIEAWDTLGMAVRAKEGVDEALDILERVGQVSQTCSSLFEHLGDMYLEKNDTKRARDAYLRAIDLSEDGLTIVPKLKKKLKGLE